MKKIFLVLSLFAFGCSSNKWTSNLYCEANPDYRQQILSLSFPSKRLSMRIDERNETLRVNMFSETSYKVFPEERDLPEIVNISASFETMGWTYELSFDYQKMKVYISRKAEDGIVRANEYHCRII